MTAREEVVRNLLVVFAVSETKWDGQNYPYDNIISLWETPEQAFAAVESLHGGHKGRKIFRRGLDLLNNGRVCWYGLGVVWENGVWADLNYDPRSKDPQFKEYLRLKEIYDSE